MNPKEAIIAITYKCNAKCVMCNIWKTKPKKEVVHSVYEKLPGTLRTINVTGGEPFLRKDLPAIIDVMNSRCNNPRIVISSNGFLPKVIETQIKRISDFKKDVGIRISIDGIGETHDRIRGTKGAFDSAIESVKVLKKLKVRDLGIAFTIMDSNIDDIENVYNLSRKLDVEFAVSSGYNSQIYFNNLDNDYDVDFEHLQNFLNNIIHQELISWSPKRWFRAYFENGVVDYALSRKRLVNCPAAKDFFYMDPQANIYPCTILDMKIGNLEKDNFGEIWNSTEAQKIRDYVKKCSYNCWMACNASSVIKRRLHVPLFWIVRNKFSSHLGRSQVHK